MTAAPAHCERPTANGAVSPETLPSRIWLCAGLILLLTAAIYWNSLDVPFIFDDDDSIVRNVYIRDLWPPGNIFKAPRQTTVDGRPMLSLSLALNHAMAGLDVRVYHATNMLIHAVAGLALFGIVRRCLRSSRLRDRFGESATGLALASAMIWVAHPLCTQAVTYIIQRAESLMAMFYLLTIYCALRAFKAPGRIAWHVLSVAACALAMATKEVAISAPVVVLLFDRTFAAGSFTQALRARRFFYAALGSTMLIQIALLLATPRPDVEGFGVGHQTHFNYLLTQLGVIAHYLRLAVWPVDLCLDYAWPFATSIREVLAPGLIVAALLAATACGLWRASAWSVAAAGFWLVLAPTSSILPLFDPIFEHRMYLPLAAVCAILTLAAYSGIVRIVRLAGGRTTVARRGGVVVAAMVVLTLGTLTVRRNRDYSSEMSLWSDVVAKRPENVRGRVNLAIALMKEGRLEESLKLLEDAVARQPRYAEGRANLGAVLTKLGRLEDAVVEFEACLALSDKYPTAHYNLGLVLEELGRIPEAIEQFSKALRVYPEYPDAHENLAYLLSRTGRADEAITHYRAALRYAPNRPKSQSNLGKLLAQKGQHEEAIPHFRAALDAEPDLLEARNNLAITLGLMGRLDEAIAEFEAGLAAHPKNASLRVNLAFALEKAGRRDGAIRHYTAALEIDPGLSIARQALARLAGGEAATMPAN